MIRLIQWMKRAWNIWKPKYTATLWSRGHLCPPLSFDTKEPTFRVSIFHDFPSKQSAVSGHPTHPGSQALWLECVPGGIINRQLNQRTLTTIPDWRLISVFIIISSSIIILIIIIYICMYWLLHFTPFALMIHRFYWHVLFGSLLERELTSSVENMGFPLSNPSPLRWWIWIIIVHEISSSIPRIIFITYSFNQRAVLANFPSLTSNYIIWHVPQVLALQAQVISGNPMDFHSFLYAYWRVFDANISSSS